MNNFLSEVVNALPGVQEAKSEAQTLATAVAIWGLIVAVELGVLIYLAGRKGK